MAECSNLNLLHFIAFDLKQNQTFALQHPEVQYTLTPAAWV